MAGIVRAYLSGVFRDARPDKAERHLAVLDATCRVDYVLALVQLRGSVSDGPHVPDEHATVRLHPAEHHVRLGLQSGDHSSNICRLNVNCVGSRYHLRRVGEADGDPVVGRVLAGQGEADLIARLEVLPFRVVRAVAGHGVARDRVLPLAAAEGRRFVTAVTRAAHPVIVVVTVRRMVSACFVCLHFRLRCF